MGGLSEGRVEREEVTESETGPRFRAVTTEPDAELELVTSCALRSRPDLKSDA